MTKYQLRIRLHFCKPRHEALSELHQTNVDTSSCVVADKRELREEGIERVLKSEEAKEGATSAGFAFPFPFGEITPETSEFLPCVLSFTGRIQRDNIVSQPGQHVGLY